MIEILRPSDMHLHLREGEMLKQVVLDSADWCFWGIIEPNTTNPILTGEDAEQYYAEIRKALPRGSKFRPVVAIQITPKTTPKIIREAHAKRVRVTKSYPYGVTTHSENGITDFEALYPVYAKLEELGMYAQFHGESLQAEWSIDREDVFIDTELRPMVERFPNLKIILEHITRARTVEFVKQAPATVAASITAHHPCLTLDDLLGGILRPHIFCKPIAKHPRDQQALLEAIMSGNPKFFLGTDSAPHSIWKKECADACAGIYSAPVAIPVLAELFEQYNALHRLEGFVSLHGPAFYGLNPPIDVLRLRKEPWEVPQRYGSGSNPVVPFMAGEILQWQFGQQVSW